MKHTFLWTFLLSISIAALTWIALDAWKYANPKPESLYIVDKYESRNHYYIQVWIEITPEEYIGYDIGDTFEGSLKCYF